MAYLTCDNLAVGHAGRAVARGISFACEPGDAVFVVGANGTGKSTLVKTLLGLLAPVAGTVSMGDGLAARDVGYLPQVGGMQRDFPASVHEVVLSGRAGRLGRRAFFNAADRAAARAALERVGAIDLQRCAFSALSGGQQQRVLLARALCATSRLLVLDEPTNGLDPHAAAMLYDTVDELRAGGLAVVAVSHDLQAALPHATHVLDFGDGTAPPSFAPAQASAPDARDAAAAPDAPADPADPAAEGEVA